MKFVEFSTARNNNEARAISKEIPKEKSSQRGCGFDCESFGHICCNMGNGLKECRKEKNCPVLGNNIKLSRWMN